MMENIILTPWQVINPSYLYLFFVLTIGAGAAVIFFRLPVKVKLVILCAYTFILHSYLPLSHLLPYGADAWRHIANKSQILQGSWPEKPLLRDGSQAGFQVGDLSYGLFWIVNVAVSKLSGLNLIIINQWLLPILWSLIFPIVLWHILKLLNLSERVRWFTIWFASLPFALQAAGSFTLPVNFGFLFFLIGLYLLLKRRADPSAAGSGWPLALYAIFLLFNYSLFFVLYLAAWAILELLRRANAWPLRRQAWLAAGLVASLALFIPLLELLSGYSELPALSMVSAAGAVKQFLGNLLGWYIAAGPRPHDIATGNILFNQPPLYAFIPNIFTKFRWWIPIFSAAFWGAVLAGIIISLKNFSRGPAETENSYKQNTIAKGWFSILTLGLFLAYFISRYLLGGEQILGRRLDSSLALFAIVCFAFFLNSDLRQRFFASLRMTNFKPFVSILALVISSVAIAASYSLGPDTRAVSTSEYRAMNFVWQQEQARGGHCVIADTYPLLALEAISSKAIIGGGFPIDANFAQPELAALYHNAARGLEIRDENAVQLLRKRDVCWFVYSSGSAPEYNKARRRLQTIFFAHGVEEYDFGTVRVYRLFK